MNTPDELLQELYRAYLGARRHKRSRLYQQTFELRLEENLVRLRDELLSGTYRPAPSTCFVIHDPKMREVFAADFRDRVVHHLLYNRIYERLERTFIADSYSCISGRGTHYGIRRLRHHILSESCNYQRPCWVLKMDIRGYFMHIDRQRLLRICRRQLGCTDALTDRLLEQTVLLDATQGCRRRGAEADWRGLPESKSLFSAPEGCGLPIGNLTSQLFSNVYLNTLDQWMKRVLGCRHYGRYVDDFYVVSSDRRWLLSLRRPVAEWLWRELGLTLADDKVQVLDVRHGVEFLGAFLKPHRTYIASRSLCRMRRKVAALSDAPTIERLASRVNSHLGVLSHFASYRLRRVLFCRAGGWAACGTFSRDWLRFVGGAHS